MRRVAAALAVAFGVGAATLLPGVPAALATTPKYVAIVIAGHGTYCARAGGSGDEVLNAVVQVAYRPSDHIIWQIDGAPSPPYTDSTHYWSYWHDTTGRWTYATTGASGYTPPAGSVEGWVFGNGSSPPPRNPSGLYAAACGYLDAPPPPPPPSSAPVVHRTTAHPTTHAPAPVSTPRRAVTSSGAGVAAVSATTAPGHTSTAPTARRSTRRAPTPTSAPAAFVPAASSTSETSPTPAPTSRRAGPRTGGGSAAPAVAGAGLAAIVAAGGGWAAWRRRRG